MAGDDDVPVAAGTPTDQLAAPQASVLVSSGRMVERQRRDMEMSSLESLDEILQNEKHPLYDICTAAKMARELGEKLHDAVMSDDPNTKNAQINTKLFLGCIKELREGGHQILSYILPRLGSTRLEIKTNDEPFEIVLSGMGPPPAEKVPDGDTTI